MDADEDEVDSDAEESAGLLQRDTTGRPLLSTRTIDSPPSSRVRTSVFVWTGWLLCMALALHVLGWVDWRWAVTALLLPLVSPVSSALAPTLFPFSTPPSPPPPPAPLLCSLPHVRRVAKRLYDTTLVEHIPFTSLPTLNSSSISPTDFLSHSTYNPQFPTQMYHNVCLLPSGGNHLLLFLNAPHLNSSEKRDRWLDLREQQALRTGERGGFLWQHYWWVFQYGDLAEAQWRYIAGTTMVEKKMAIHWGRSWNFGHMLSDYVVPYVMNFINLGEHELTRNAHPVDRFLVHSGCTEYRSWVEEEGWQVDPDLPAAFNTTSNRTEPALRRAADENTVWPLVSTVASPFHWMFRMALQELSGEGRTPHGQLTDRLWHGMRLLAVFNRSAAGDERCKDERWPEPVCFERLWMPSRQEDRDNRAAPDAENARAMWVIRNVTLGTFGVAPPVHVPLNATRVWGVGEEEGVRNGTGEGVRRKSTVSERMFGSGKGKVREGKGRPLPRVLLYGRQDASRRMWVDVEETQRVLAECTTFTLTFLSVMEQLNVCEQMAVFSQHDVFIMPHGAALFGVLWAPVESLVVEVFPTPQVDWTWLQMLVRGMGLDWVRLDGDERVAAPNLGLREGGQDDPFNMSPHKVLRLLEGKGLDVREAWAALNASNTAAG